MYNTVLQKHDTTSFPLIFQTNFRQKAIQPRLFAHSPLCIAVQCAAQWFQMAQNPPKIKFPVVILQFSENSNHFRFRRLPYLRYVKLLQTCEYDQSISRKFLNLFFGGILKFGPTLRYHSGVMHGRERLRPLM